MLDKNDVITSYRDRLKAVLETTACGLKSALNVYDEDDIRNEVSPVSPYVYIVTAYIRPTKLTLPFIGIHVTSTSGNPFEMGRPNGNFWELRAHVFGRSNGQRNVLSSYIADPQVVGDLTINDSSTGSFIETAAHITERRTIIPTAPDDAEDVEGSWRYRDVVQSTYQTIT